MTTWICEGCGHEFLVEGDEIPIECPICGCLELKRPNQNGGLKPIRP